MNNQNKSQLDSESIVNDVLETIISRIMKLYISKAEQFSIVNFSHRQINTCLKSFDEILSNKIEPKPIHYNENEPHVSQKDRMAKNSITCIIVDRLPESNLRVLTAKPKVTTQLKDNSKTKISRSFNIRSLNNRSASKDQNKSMNTPTVNMNPPKHNRIKIKSKQPLCKVDIQVPIIKKARKRTPEPEISILEKEIRKPIPQFRFFYTKQVAKPTLLHMETKDTVFKPIKTLTAGVCSVEDHVLITESAPNDPKQIVAKEKPIWQKKRIDRLPVDQIHIEPAPIPTRKKINFHMIKIYDKEKLKRLLSKSLIN